MLFHCADPKGEGWSIYAIWADSIDGCIDPGHIVGEDGKRYLFVNGIRKVRLTDDGLATVGKLEMA